MIPNFVRKKLNFCSNAIQCKLRKTLKSIFQISSEFFIIEQMINQKIIDITLKIMKTNFSKRKEKSNKEI